MSDAIENILEAGRRAGREGDDLPTALTIAGSDSGGGAGAQADLKTFAACGIHGTSVLTVVTAQNTRDVTGLQPLPESIVRGQYDAVVDDFEPEAAKTGALGNEQTVNVVAELLEDEPLEPLVVDPVMISKHGDPLLPEPAQHALRDLVLPKARLATPNRHEAEALSGETVRGVESMKEAAKQIYDLGPDAVLVKGSHLDDIVKDILYDGSGFIEYGADKIKSDRLHGSGCVFSSAVTAQLVRGVELPEALGFAREFISRAIETAPKLGGGISPVNPMHTCWSDE